MMDCLVFLNGHLLEECKDKEEFGVLVNRHVNSVAAGMKPSKPEFSYTNVYYWQFKEGKNNLHFVETLYAQDRIDLVNPRSGARGTLFAEYPTTLLEPEVTNVPKL